MKGGALDARSRLTPLLGTAMAGVAAGCLLLFAVFARQAILNTNLGLGVLPDAPSTAIRQAITLLTPLQTARPEPPAEEIAPAAPAVAPPSATTSPDTGVVAPPADDFTRPPTDERDDGGRGVGNLPRGERLPTGLARQDSDRWLDAREKARENRSQAREKARENRSQAREDRGQAREKARENRSQSREKAKDDSSKGHGRGKGKGGPPKGRGRH